MQALLRDLRFAARMFVASPGFTLATIFTLALGIGANTAIFTVTNALLLRPFPFRDPAQLAAVAGREKSGDQPTNLLRYEFLRDHSHSFSGVAVWAQDNLNLSGNGDAVQVPVARVSPSFFTVLGVTPQLGRTFTEDEGTPAGRPVVMLSDALWRSRYHADPKIVGKTVTLDSTSDTVVGILPRNVEFPFVGKADVWTPRYFELSLMTPERLRQGVGYLNVLARLRPAVTHAQADAELAVLDRQYREQNPGMPDANPSIATTVGDLRETVVGDIRRKVMVLTCAVGFVLLIACANVASMLLTRALGRRREIAMRAALGAGRGAIVRQLLTESMLLAMAAGVAGTGLGWAATRALVKWGADRLPEGFSIGVDPQVLLFTVAISLAAGILFGLAPAVQLARIDLNATLRDEGRGASAGHGRARMRGLLVVSQVALSLLLLVGAGLLLRSFAQLLRTNPGFDAHGMLTMDISLSTQRYAKPAQQIAFFDDVLRRVDTIAGVNTAAMSAAPPLGFIRMTPVLPEGQPEVPLAQRAFVDIEAISPKWFAAMRVPMLAGRTFSSADDADAPKAVIVNETFARAYWPGQNPVGKHIAVGRWPGAEVVGMAADVKNQGLEEKSQPQLYLSFPQIPWGNMHLLVRTNVPPMEVASAVRAQIAEVDKDQAVTGVQTVDDLLDTSRAQPRFTMVLMGVFAATALVLAMIGIYGVLSYTVAQRRQEFGIRMALGAERAEILRLVLREGLALTLVGIGAGLAAALLLTRLAASLLYQVGAHDPVTFVVAPTVFLAVALAASYLPARRATRVNPVEAMR
ncbi:MAG: ABC transporter permease [Terracidiphilus sp.]